MPSITEEEEEELSALTDRKLSTLPLPKKRGSMTIIIDVERRRSSLKQNECNNN